MTLVLLLKTSFRKNLIEGLVYKGYHHILPNRRQVILIKKGDF